MNGRTGYWELRDALYKMNSDRRGHICVTKTRRIAIGSEVTNGGADKYECRFGPKGCSTTVNEIKQIRQTESEVHVAE
jgi:hypothetical protein